MKACGDLNVRSENLWQIDGARRLQHFPVAGHAMLLEARLQLLNRSRQPVMIRRKRGLGQPGRFAYTWRRGFGDWERTRRLAGRALHDHYDDDGRGRSESHRL